MAAELYSFLIEQGTTFQLEFEFTDDTGSKLDFTGFTAGMHIRESIKGISTILELSTTVNNNGSKISFTGLNNDLQPSDGVISVLISATDTDALNFPSAVYDLEIYGPGGYVARLLKGQIRLDKQVTR